MSPSSENSSSPESRPPSVYELLHNCYYPAALGHLPQPVPKDLPAHLDARGVFTFQDAFEDLLAVSQGRSLPDIESRYQQSKMLRQMYPRGEPTWLWIRRLQSQGLVGPTSGSCFSTTTPAQQPIWTEFQRGLEQGAHELWRGIRDVVDEPAARQALAEADQVWRELREQFSGDRGNETSPLAGGEKDEKSDRPADTFDELYSAVTSAFAQENGSWQAFKNAINKDREPSGDNLERNLLDERNSQPTTSTESDSNGKRTSETRSEYVDRFGYKHVTIQRKQYDENGKEIGSSKIVTVTPAKQSDSDGTDNEKGDSNTSNSNGKGGWFW